MSDTSQKSPFDALRRAFVLPKETSTTVAKVVLNDRIRGHAFALGPLHLVIDTMRHPCEVYDELPLCRLPNSPFHLIGMANQRGNIIPVFDLHQMLGYPAEGNRNYYLIVGNRDDVIGFRINALPRKVEVSETERISTALPIPHLLEPHLRHFYQQHEQIYVDWNVRSFLDSLVSGNSAATQANTIK